MNVNHFDDLTGIDSLDPMQLAELKAKVLRGQRGTIGDGGNMTVGSFRGCELVKLDSSLGGFSYRRYGV